MTKNSLGRAHHLGRGVEELRNIFMELMEIREDFDPDADADLLGQLSQLVQDTRKLIEDNRSHARMSMKFFWSDDLDSEVQRINRGLTSISRRLDRRVKVQARGSHFSAENQTLDLTAPSLIHRIPRKPIGSNEAANSPSPLATRRRASSTPLYLPTTLILRDADNDAIREPIRLDKFSILDRDDFPRSRTIQYQPADQSVTVTHEIRYGTIPWTPDGMEAREVSFLENQMLTLETKTEFVIYLLSPLYRFPTAETCDDFMARIRERSLVGTFLTKEVSMSRIHVGDGLMSFVHTMISRDITLARCKLV